MGLALGSTVLAGCGGGDDELGLLGAPVLQRSAQPSPGDEGAAVEPGH